MINRTDVTGYLRDLQNKICAGFQTIESSDHKFTPKTWEYQNGKGGGEMRVLRGDTFEKAAVNWSAVEGDRYPLDESRGPFFATGVSLITHMTNPKMPTVHFNIRYMENGTESWFGGGFDLTPMGFPFDEDTQHFHLLAKKSLDPFGGELYQKFSNWAKEYYFIKHYGCERGVGGIFFDQYKTARPEEDFKMWQSVGNHFLEAIVPIYEKRMKEPYSAEDRKTQLRYRARYVEYNLLYDRGTKFGFNSGGNPEAILCSMPPLAAW